MRRLVLIAAYNFIAGGTKATLILIGYLPFSQRGSQYNEVFERFFIDWKSVGWRRKL